MDLDVISIWSGIISSITSSIAIVVGGIWVYRNYIYNRMGVWNLKISVNPEAISYNEVSRLLKINISLYNAGNIKVTPGSNGCQVTVKKISAEAVQNRSVDLDVGEIITKDNVLRRYCDSKIDYKGYIIEPKCEYHELECIMVSKGDILSILTEFFWKDNKDSITEYSVFYVK